ncbi:MAG: HD domain-containing protein [Alphaproteobacteria bacterium]|nr:HD domain-containing protein [Alphaproteobacteria bacterium]
MRALLHYAVTMVVIPVYGIQVCPFIESLSPVQVAWPIVGLLALQFAIRAPLRARMVGGAAAKGRVARAFWLELGLFVASALGLTAFNAVVHGFPVESGLKVLVGIAGLGFFAATDIALAEERALARDIAQGGEPVAVDGGHFPMTAKMMAFAVVSVVVLVTVFMLLVVKDLDWIVEVGATIPLSDARLSILKEFAFILAVALPHAINVIRSFSLNLHQVLALQNGVLGAVTGGDYTRHVPVARNDEFGLMAARTNVMVERIRAHAEELARTRDVTILSLASLAETRDNETGAHILRTQRYVRALARHLRDHPNFRDALDEETIDLLYKSAPLHDVGKVGIPDRILLKPGKLDDDEFAIMKTHATLGADALAVAEKELGTNSFMRFAREISATHHEKWDGTGYPNGLRETMIPLSGRLMAVADVYDALISKRVYKPAFPHEKAMEIIREGRGRHFDPDVVDALDAVEAEFKSIAAAYGDQHTRAE